MTISLEPIGVFLAFVITLMVLSYVFGDNPLYRLACYIFIGSSAGYIAAIIIKDVLIAKLQNIGNGGISQNEILLLGSLMVLSLLLFSKISPSFSLFGNIPMALIVGVGTAIAIEGALFGTLIPAVFGIGAGSSANQIPLILLSMLATIATLFYFNFTVRKRQLKNPDRSAWLNVVAKTGKFFIMVALGVIFAGVLTASISALVESFSFFSEILRIALNIN